MTLLDEFKYTRISNLGYICSGYRDSWCTDNVRYVQMCTGCVQGMYRTRSYLVAWPVLGGSNNLGEGEVLLLKADITHEG